MSILLRICNKGVLHIALCVLHTTTRLALMWNPLGGGDPGTDEGLENVCDRGMNVPQVCRGGPWRTFVENLCEDRIERN